MGKLSEPNALQRQNKVRKFPALNQPLTDEQKRELVDMGVVCYLDGPPSEHQKCIDLHNSLE